jgi:hypothetical protein
MDAISAADARVMRKTGIGVDTMTWEGDPPAAIVDPAGPVLTVRRASV